jgi:hypothetical protein
MAERVGVKATILIFPLKLQILSPSGVRFRSGDCGDKNRMDRARCRALADSFRHPISRVLLLVLLLVSAATGEKNHYVFKLLWH